VSLMTSVLFLWFYAVLNVIRSVSDRRGGDDLSPVCVSLVLVPFQEFGPPGNRKRTGVD
jgi:uncharacterized protein YggT (Ycf19 family)